MLIRNAAAQGNNRFAPDAALAIDLAGGRYKNTAGYDRTNNLSNSTMAGASTSQMPTSWRGYNVIALPVSSAGVTLSCEGVGVEDGFTYVRYRLAGTTTGVVNGGTPIDVNTIATIPALANETWAWAAYLRKVSGDPSAVDSLAFRMDFRDNAEALLHNGGGVSLVDIAAPGTPLRNCRIGGTYTPVNAGTFKANLTCRISEATIGTVIDFTFDIAAPMMGKASSWQSLGSFIPTSTGPVTQNCTFSNVLADIGALTVTRSTGGYAENVAGDTLTWFGANELRRSAGRGALIEPAATNLVPTSSTHSQANGAVKTSSTIEGPDGTTTASRFDLTGVVGLQDIIFSAIAALSASTTYSGAVWVRGIAGQTISAYSKRANTGTFTSAPVRTITLTGRWQRIADLSWTLAADNNNGQVIIQRKADDTATTLDVWNYQLEAGDKSTSDIVTTGSAATRAADAPRLDGLNVASPATLAVRAVPNGTAATASSRYMAQLDDGTGNNRTLLGINASGNLLAFTASGTVNQLNVTHGAATAVIGMAVRNVANDSRSAANGALGAANATALAPAAATTLRIGNGHVASVEFSGYVEGIYVYAFAANDNRLQTLASGQF